MKKILGVLCIFVLIFASCSDSPQTGSTNQVDGTNPCNTVAFDEKFNEDSPIDYYQASLDTIEKQFEDGSQYFYSYDIFPNDSHFLNIILFNSRAVDCTNNGLIRLNDSYGVLELSDLTAFSINEDGYILYVASSTEDNEEINIEYEILETEDYQETFDTMNASFILENLDALRAVDKLDVSELSAFNGFKAYTFTIDSKDNGEVPIVVNIQPKDNVIVFSYELDKDERYTISFTLDPNTVSKEAKRFQDLLNNADNVTE